MHPNAGVPMTRFENRTVSLTAEEAEYIDAKVASGEYGSASEVVREGLRNMQEHDAAIEKWLREEVVPSMEAYKADPSSAKLLTVDEVREQLRKRHEMLSNATA
jgi:antitoxin ParD1/3/4